MFESIIADVLNRICSQYVKDIDGKSLSIGIWKGDVELNNVEVRGDALDDLGLPIRVRTGFVRKIRLIVPWKKLKSEPVVVDVEGVFLLAGPRGVTEEPDELETAQREMASKLQRLAVEEASRQQKSSAKEAEPGEGVTARLVTRIIDNIQIAVSNVHVRFEDALSDPRTPFCVGVTMESLDVQSTDQKGEPKFIADAPVVYKRLDLSRLAVYWETGSDFTPFSPLPDSELLDTLASGIATKEKRPSHSYVLSPMSSTLKALQNKSKTPDLALPQYVVELLLNEIGLELSESQLQTAVKATAYFANFGTHSKYRKLRPDCPVFGHVRDWWQYAYAAVLLEVRKTRHKWTWKYLKKRRDDRRAYIALFQVQLRGDSYSESESARLEELHMRLSYEDLKLYRSMARATFVGRQKTKKEESGWSSWWSRKKKVEEKPSEDALQLTDEQRTALFDLADLDYDGKPLDTDLSIQAPAEWVKARAVVELKRFRLVLVGEHEFVGGQRLSAKRDLCEVLLTGVNLNAHLLLDSMRVGGAITGLEATDMWDGKTCFKKLLSVSEDKKGSAKDFIQFSFETRSPGSPVDAAVELTMASLDLVYARRTVERLISFFAVDPFDRMQLSDLEDAAMEQYEALKTVTQASIAESLRQHKTIDLNMQIGAPTLIAPGDTSDETTPVMVLDLGFLTLKSEHLGDKAGELAVYDHYCLNLSKVHCLVAPSIKAWQTRSAASLESMRVIPQFDVTLSVKNSIVPQDFSRPRLIVGGKLSTLSVSVSLDNVRDILDIINRNLPAGAAEQVDVPAVAPVRSAMVSVDAQLLEDVVVGLEEGAEKRDEALEKAQAEQVAVDVRMEIGRMIVDVQDETGNIAALSVLGMSAQLALRSFDTKIQAEVARLEVVDHLVDPTCEADCRFLISSPIVAANEKLVAVDFAMLSPKSPDYHGTDMVLGGRFSRLTFRLNGRTVVRLLDFIGKIQPETAASSPAPSSVVQPSASPSRPNQGPTFCCKFTLESVNAVLNSEKSSDGADLLLYEPLAIAEVAGMGLDIDMKNDSIIVAGHMESVLVEDAAGSGPFTNVVSKVDSKTSQVIDFSYRMFGEDEVEDRPAPHCSALLRAQVGGIQVVFIRRFVDQIVQYFVDLGAQIEQGQSVVNDIAAAAAAAVEAGRETAEAVAASPVAKQLLLDVFVVSPTVIIPRSALSEKEAIVADFGQVAVSSKLLGPESAPTANQMHVELEGMHMRSCLRKEDAGLQEKIMNDVKVTAEVIMSLVSTPGIPGMAIDVDISNILMSLGKGQYALLLNVLFDNVLAGWEEAAPVPQAKGEGVPGTVAKEEEEKGADKKSALLQKTGRGPPPVLAQESNLLRPRPKMPQPDENAPVSMQITAALGRVGLDVGRMDGVDAIAGVSISGMDLRLTMQDSGEMMIGAAITAVGIRLLRPDVPDAFRDVLVPGEPESEEKQLSFSYRAMGGAAGAQDISFNLRRPVLHVCPPLLVPLLEFVVRPFISPEEKPKSDVERTVQPSESGESRPPPQGGFYLSAVITEPEMRLLSKPKAEKVLAMKATLETRLDFMPDDQGMQIEALLSQISAFVDTTEAGVGKVLNILAPMSLRVQYIDGAEASLAIARFDDVDARVSYRDIMLSLEVVQAIVEAVSAVFYTNEPLEEEVRSVEKLSDKKTMKEAPSAVEQHGALAVNGSPAKREQLSFLCTSASLIVIDDLLSEVQVLPVLQGRLTQFRGLAENWASATALRAKVEMSLAADYFNRRVAAWEPFLEPYSLSISLQTAAETNSDSESEKISQGALELCLQATEVININVTSAFIESVVGTLLTWGSEVQSSSSLARSSFSPCWIVNDTASQISCRRVSHTSAEVQWEAVEAGQRVAPPSIVAGWGDSGRRSAHIYISKRSTTATSQILEVRIAGSDHSVTVPLNQVGMRVRQFTARQPGPPIRVVFDVQLNAGSYVLTVRSTTQIVNNTTLVLGFLSRLREKAADQGLVDGIEPGSSRSVPLAMAEDPQVVLFECKPVDSEAVAAPPRLSRGSSASWVSLSVPSSMQSVKETVWGAGSGNSRLFFAAYLVRTGKVGSESATTSLTLAPPLVLENHLCTPLHVTLTSKSNKRITLERGESRPLYDLDMSLPVDVVLQVPGFNESSHLEIHALGKELEYTQNVIVKDDSGRELALVLDSRSDVVGTRRVSISVEVWIRNLTGLPLVFGAGRSEAAGQAVDGAYHFSDSRKWAEEYTDFSADGEDKKRQLPISSSHPHNVRHLLFGHGAARVRVADTPWSSKLSFKNAGMSGTVTIPDAKRRGLPQQEYELAVSVAMADPERCGTKLVTFCPRYLIVNQLECDVSVRQAGVSESDMLPLQLHTGDVVPFMVWPDESQDRRLSFRLDQSTPAVLEKCQQTSVAKKEEKLPQEWLWSGSFALEGVEDLMLRLRCRDLMTVIASVSLRYDDNIGMTVIVLSFPDRRLPPYRIENMSELAVRAYQAEVSDESHAEIIGAGKTIDWAWDVPDGAHTVIVEADEWGSHPVSMVLDKIGPQRAIKAHGQRHRCAVVAVGPIRVLRIHECKSTERAKHALSPLASATFASLASGIGGSLTEMSEKAGSSTPHSDDEDEDWELLEGERMDSAATVCVKVCFCGIGISLIDDAPQELLYVTLGDMNASVAYSASHMSISFSLGDFQIDNQVRGAQFPVMLARSRAQRGDMKMVEASLVWSNVHSSIDFFKLISLGVQPIDLKVDDVFVFALLEAIGRLLQSLNVAMGSEAIDSSSNESIYSETLKLPSVDVARSRKIYCELLLFQPFKVNVTFSLASGKAERSGKGKAEESKGLDPLGRAGNLLARVFRTIGMTVVNVEDAPLRLNALVIEDAFGSQDTLLSRLVAHYVRQVIRESYKVVGSFEIVGNPVSLVTGLGTGVMDFFVEPAQGAIESPEAFARGFARGTTSLLKKSVYGAFGTASKITESASKGFAAISGDDHYSQKRRELHRDQPKHVGEGLLFGARDLGRGVFHGVTGLVAQPMKGAKEEGALGFFKGLGKGVVGVAAKPVTGVLDLASQATQGIRNTATVFDRTIERVRPPRTFAREAVSGTGDIRLIVKPYVLEEAQGLFLLTRTEGGKYSKEQWRFHSNVNDRRVVIVTAERVFYIKKENGALDWVVKFKHVKKIGVSSGCVVISSKQKGPGKGMDFFRSGFGGDVDRIIECGDTKLLRWLFQQLQVELNGWRKENGVVDSGS